MTKIRLLLADDHSLIREGFKSLLGKNENFEIVGEAENGRELIALTRSLIPDIILADISMPSMTGLEAVDTLIKEYPSIKFILLTMHEEREYIMNALKIGVSGYILKNVERSELEKAILTVYEGGRYFSPVVTNILVDSVHKTETNDVDELSPREKEVLELVATGKSTKQIADQLGISIRTVESHRINMLKKLKVSNSAELIRKALELKIIKLNAQ
jgi:DNA-binding NarL/FixJ family response regulator